MEILRISRYRILRPLGSGGMGEVYAAEDERLRRKVAIKLIASDKVADSEARERFEREAQAASALNHPNICTIFEINGYSITRKGWPSWSRRTLQPAEMGRGTRRCSRRSAFPRHHPPRHQAGKHFRKQPRQRKILDFGLAKLQAPGNNGATVSKLSTALTRMGSPMGTVAYMSPEQARGEELDTRTDLFSLGAVLYELASGQTPFPGAIPAVVFSSILTRTPVPVTQIRPDIPAELERIINKALEKDRQSRYQTAEELKQDLNRLRRASEQNTVENLPALAPSSTGKQRLPRRALAMALGIAALLVVTAPAWFWLRSKTTSTDTFARRRPTIAVLPFQNASRDNNIDYLSVSLPDEVITTLSYAPRLSVRPFSLSQQLAAQATKARQEIAHWPMDFGSFMLGHVLLREGHIDEALPHLQPVPAGESYALVRECRPEARTTKCDEAAKRSEVSFLAIPDADAWYFGASMLAWAGKEQPALRLLDAAAKHNFCAYPSLDHDPMFDSIRSSPAFRETRQTAIACHYKFAPYAKLRIP